MAEKHRIEMTQFSQQMQNAKDYNSSYSRIEEIECVLLQNASDCKDYRPCEKLHFKSSLGGTSNIIDIVGVFTYFYYHAFSALNIFWQASNDWYILQNLLTVGGRILWNHWYV